MISAPQEIRQTLVTMFDQWNGEDQKSYMQHYWKSDDIGIALYRWTHDTPREKVAGCTSQVFRNFDGAWLVVNENSARVPAA